ncbi:MAG TPA: hypothetical protein VK559_08250 [Ferruginibacter sp.]|nr:hypothetical protein [Ferruginibacter sp.]
MTKHLLVTIFLVGIYFTGISQQLNCVDPSHIAFAAKITSVKNMDQGIYISIKTTVTNNSSDTLRYLSTTCSWGKNYVINKEALNIPVASCNEDSAVLITIAPHQYNEKIIRIISLYNAEQLHGIKFKVGMKFVQACDLDKASKELRRSKNMIWSNNLQLKN